MSHLIVLYQIQLHHVYTLRHYSKLHVCIYNKIHQMNKFFLHSWQNFFFFFLMKIGLKLSEFCIPQMQYPVYFQVKS